MELRPPGERVPRAETCAVLRRPGASHLMDQPSRRRPRQRWRFWAPFVGLVAVFAVVVVAATAGEDNTSAAQVSSGSGVAQIASSVPTYGVSKDQITVGFVGVDPAGTSVLGALPKDIMTPSERSAAW